MEQPNETMHNKQNDPITQEIIKKDKMLLFITLTQRCQLNCLYCGNE